eukprot:928472-Amphidinium_carterae.1
MEEFNPHKSLLWHGSWHLGFIPNANVEHETLNLTRALSKQGHDWTHTRSTISRCCRGMRDLTAALNPPWQELRELVSKNK